MVLTQDEIDGCRDAFLAFDKDRSGTIDVWELRQVLEGARQAVCGCARGPVVAGFTPEASGSGILPPRRTLAHRPLSPSAHPPQRWAKSPRKRSFSR